MSFGQFAVSLIFGIVSVLLPLLIVIAIVALCVFIARKWIDRKS